MSVMTAAMVLAWACLIILSLAMAGMLRQLRELQAEVAHLGAPRWSDNTLRQVRELAGEGPLLLLILDPGCSSCDAVHKPFSQLSAVYPSTRFEVLAPTARWADAPQVRSRVDQRLVAELGLPWAPALLHADATGTVLATQPVPSPDQLGEQVAGLLGNGLATAPKPGGS